jgi:hypothetical protein
LPRHTRLSYLAESATKAVGPRTERARRESLL